MFVYVISLYKYYNDVFESFIMQINADSPMAIKIFIYLIKDLKKKKNEKPTILKSYIDLKRVDLNESRSN